MNGYILTPIGAIVIATYSFLIFLVMVILRRFIKKSPWLWRGLKSLAFILLLLPWLEEAWISWHFAQACKDAGVKVYRQVEVEGYGISRKDLTRKNVTEGEQFRYDPTRVADFEKMGFRFYEDILADGSARHLERTGNRVMVTLRDVPEARYYQRYAYQPTPFRTVETIGWKLEKGGRQIVDIQTGEILSQSIKIYRILPTYEALILGLLGPPVLSCPKTPEPSLWQETLKPKKTKLKTLP